MPRPSVRAPLRATAVPGQHRWPYGASAPCNAVPYMARGCIDLCVSNITLDMCVMRMYTLVIQRLHNPQAGGPRRPRWLPPRGSPPQPAAPSSGRRNLIRHADQTGQSVTEFLTTSAIERAHEVLADQRRLAALTRPPGMSSSPCWTPCAPERGSSRCLLGQSASPADTSVRHQRFDLANPSKAQRKAFDCGEPTLNRWLAEQARRAWGRGTL